MLAVMIPLARRIATCEPQAQACTAGFNSDAERTIWRP